jgi:transaldolase
VPQALAVGEAVERALRRREADGLDVASMHPVCTLMIGRLDDWMRVLADRDDIAIDPAAINWAGIAAFKRAYGIYRERGYRARLLAAAYRHRLHWTELVGGDVILTMTHQWQARFNASGIDPRPRIDVPVDPAIVAELTERIPDFGRAFEPDGLSPAEFDTYGATVRTLRGFVKSYHDLQGAIRDIVLPDPDVPPPA